MSDYPQKLKAPSLESFIRASTAMKDQELRLSGLVVVSKLTNACQPLADVSKAKIQVNKIALIRLANWTEAVCSLEELVEHAQNAGYSVMIFFDLIFPNLSENETQFQDKLMIPVLLAGRYDCYEASFLRQVIIDDADLLAVDRTNVEIAIMTKPEDFNMIQQYSRRLYYWFLLSPVIILEWLRRRKKLCCVSGDQQVEGYGVPEENALESGLNSAADYEDTQGNYNPETEHGQTRGETQPLLLVLNDTFANGHRRPRAIRRVLTYLRKLFGKLAVNSGYVVLVVVALPVGISSGGWSFFRFDQNEKFEHKTFWDDLITPNHSRYWLSSSLFDSFLPLLWSPLQIFCFFLYSKFACKSTWTVPTNFSKLIRSDWFASNMYLLILGVVVPYCSFTIIRLLSGSPILHYTTWSAQSVIYFLLSS